MILLSIADGQDKGESEESGMCYFYQRFWLMSVIRYITYDYVQNSDYNTSAMLLTQHYQPSQ